VAPPRRTKAEQGEATRAHLVAVARRLFGTNGYGATSIGDVTREAAVTRGALYHHFTDKRALFEAVFEAVEQALVERIAGVVAREQRPERRLGTGLDAFLDACLDPEYQRVCLLDAPSVLGWERWRELEERYGLGLTRVALEDAMEHGVVRRQEAEPLAHVVVGALTQAALAIGRAGDVADARQRYGRALELLVDGLRPPAA
jgi:AcrR family transcriptional regulator